MTSRVELATDRFFTVSLDLLCTAGFDGYFRALNPAWTRTLGWSIEQLRSRPFIEFVHPEDRKATVAETLRLQAGLETISFENRYRHADGSYRWLLWSATASADERTYYAVARDDTGRRRAEDDLRAAKEAAERANLAKSEFLSRMSHELRTPLTSILGFSQLIEMGTLDHDDRAQAIHQIRKAGQHLLDVINEILDIARVEAGRMPLSMEPVPIDGVVADAEDLVRPLAGQRRIALRREGSPDALARCVLADRQRLKQVLLNLLANAVKYCGGGCTVTLAVEERPGELMRVSVRDNGPGIDPALHERLFTPFDRLGAEGRGEEGSGIGLALSKRLVEAMGGTIDVESEPGRGSTFWVELTVTDGPLKRYEQQGEGALPAAGGAAGTRVSTILSIEDNPANTTLVEYALRQRPGARVMAAVEGRLGVELARRHRPDLTLLDLNLPDIDGRDVLDELKGSADTADIPVVVLSADAMPARVSQLRAAGADAYLTKPLDVKEFLQVLDRLLGDGRMP